MKVKNIILLICIVTTFVLEQSAAEQSNEFEFKFDETLSLATSEERLPLLGKVQFRYWGFLVYEVAFYSNSQNQETLYEQPFFLQLAYYRSLDRDDFSKSAKTIMKKDKDIPIELVEEELNTWNEFIEPVQKGDRYTIAFNPDGTIILDKNGKTLGSVQNAKFAKAYTKIWLGRHSVLGDDVKYLLPEKTEQLAYLNQLTTEEDR